MFSVVQKRVLLGSCIACVALLVLVCSGCQSASVRAQRYFDSGKNYFDQHKYAEASIAFQNSLKRNPQNWEAHYYIGRSELELRHYQSAYRELQGVVDSHPSYVPARLDLAELFLLGNKPDKAREQVEAVQANEPGNPRAQILLGRTYLVEKNSSRAIQEFEKAKQLSPQDPSVWGLSGLAEIGAKQYPAAEKNFRRALELDPGSAEAYVNLANLLRLTGRTGEVEAVLRGGLAKIPKSLPLDISLADFYYQQGRVPDIENLFADMRKQTGDVPEFRLALGDFWLTHNLLPRAIAEYEAEKAKHPSEYVDKKLVSAYLSAGRTADAERLNAPLLKKNPKDPGLRTFDGALAYSRNDFAKATEELQLVLKDEPNSPIANYYLGLSWMALDQPDRARNAFQECVRINGQFTQAYLKLAELAAQSGDWNLVSEYAKTLLQQDPRMPDGYLLLGQAFVGKGDTASAEKLLRIFKTLPNIPPQFYELSARVSALENNQVAANDALQRALSLTNQPFAVISRYAEFQAQRGQAEIAATALKNWMVNAPPQPDSYELLARFQINQKDFDGAESSCKKAMELGPDRWLPHFLLGEVWHQRGRPAEALAEYEETIRRNPRLISAYVGAGDLEMEQGQYEKAKSYLDAAKNQDPDSVYANRALVRWYAERGENLEVALTTAQALKSRFPADQYLSDTLGWLYYQKRLYSLALQQLKPAALALPDNAAVQYHLGMTYFQMGQSDQARLSLKRALKLGLASSTAAKAEETLGQLSKG